MTELIGVVHGAYERNLLIEAMQEAGVWDVDLPRATRELPTCISPEIIQKLSSLKKGSIIGIENLDLIEWQKVTSHLRRLTNPDASFGGTDYFDILPQIISDMGHNVIYLEEQSLWYQYNRAVSELMKIQKESAFFSKPPFTLKGHLERAGYSEKIFAAKTEIQKIHLLERDEALLKNIALAKPDIVFAGLGHTEYWMANQSHVARTHGVQFTNYITDDRTKQPAFNTNPIPNPKLAYEFTTLRRALNLKAEKKISEKNPNWVGLWDVNEPSRGYFEMFIDTSGAKFINGTIEDCLGSSEFAGQLTKQEISFLKEYTDCIQEALPKPIQYISEKKSKKHQAFSGSFYLNQRYAGSFYIEQPRGLSPLEMTEEWFKLAKPYD